MFEWDPKKARKNALKHGVTFHAALTVFGDPFAVTFADLGHSECEDRYVRSGIRLRTNFSPSSMLRWGRQPV